MIRNSLGFFIAAFSACLGTGVALDAEILAGIHAVRFAKRWGWNRIWLETDCTLARSFLASSGSNIPWRILPDWKDYEENRRNSDFQLSHIHREGNAIADYLSKLRSDNVWIGACPDFLSNMLFLDMNTEYFRVI